MHRPAVSLHRKPSQGCERTCRRCLRVSGRRASYLVTTHEYGGQHLAAAASCCRCTAARRAPRRRG
uniref:Uncharacterized protein n=1 Tax=Arundo donax TaxID=35708 RepID=A0A0A9A489_ARUDO